LISAAADIDSLKVAEEKEQDQSAHLGTIKDELLKLRELLSKKDT